MAERFITALKATAPTFLNANETHLATTLSAIAELDPPHAVS
jgi:hypothetical protein